MSRNLREGWIRLTGVALHACILGLVALGCAGATPNPADRPAAVSPSEALADAPNWLRRGCRAHWPNRNEGSQIVCGIGSAPSNRNLVAARETAIARARADIARSLEVTIESLVRLDDQTGQEAELETIVHQLASASLRGIQLEEVWRSPSGEVHAMVSLDVDRVRDSVRSQPTLSLAARESLAERAADAFAELDAAFDAENGPDDNAEEPN